MEFDLTPKKPRGRKPKFKKEVEDPLNNKKYNSLLFTILGEDGTSPCIAPNHRAKLFKEPDTDRLVFEKVSIPKTMKSIYWKYFGFPADLEGEILTKQKVICLLCSSQFSYSKNTTNIRRHLELKHRAEFNQLNESVGLPPSRNVIPSRRKKTKPAIKQLPQVHIKSEVEDHYSVCLQDEEDHVNKRLIQTPVITNKISRVSSSKSIVNLIADCVIRDLQPPSIVNNKGFRHLVSNLSPHSEMPSEASIIQEFVPKMYDTVKNAMYIDITAINMTDNKFSLSLEHWEANGREYISYYINYLHNEETFTTKLLHTFLLDQDAFHDTFYHQDMFNIVCNSWNIKTSNIKAAILASDNVALYQALTNLEVRILPCLSHTLTHMCLKAFQMSSISAVLSKCRNIISQIYNKNNFAIEVTFQDAQNEDDTTSTFLSLDNPHVWTSTLNMLEALNAARSKLNVLLEVNESCVENGIDNQHLTEEEWFIVARVVETFNPIKVTVVTLSEENPALASLILPLYLQLINYHLKIQPGDDTLTTELKTYFVEYLAQKYSSADAFLQICTALDPRVKKLPYIEEQDVFGGAINDILLALEPPSAESTKYYTDVVEQDSKKNVRLSGMEFLLGNVTSSTTPTPVKSSLPSHADNIAHEISLYRLGVPASLNQCPLTWWKTECNRFPNLYSLALKYNCVPATCVSSKNMDMKSQCTYVERRKLLSMNAQAVLNHLLFLHHNS